jgi:hypothetical protein
MRRCWTSAEAPHFAPRAIICDGHGFRDVTLDIGVAAFRERRDAAKEVY